MSCKPEVEGRMANQRPEQRKTHAGSPRAGWSVGIVGILLLLASPVAAAPASSKQLNTEGFRAYQRGDFAAAKDKFEQAIEADSTNLQATYNLACTLARQGQGETAKAYLRYLVRRDPRGKLIRKMKQDPDLQRLRDDGSLAALVARGGLAEKAHRRIAKALAAGAKASLPPGEDVLITDLDQDGDPEAFWWNSQLDLALATDVVAVRRGTTGGLEVTPLGLLPGYVEDGSLLASAPGFGLLVSAFAASHNSTEYYLVVRVEHGKISVVWENSTSLESTCLSDDCEGAEDSDDQIGFTFMNLDADSEAELIVERTTDCQFGAGQVTVLDLVRGRMRPLPRARRLLAAKAASLRPRVLRGDERAVDQLLRLTPVNEDGLPSLLEALRQAEPGSAPAKGLGRLLEHYKKNASDRAWRRVLADPWLRRHYERLPKREAEPCHAGYEGWSYADEGEKK